MSVIRILGPGCANCAKTANLIAEVARELGVDATIEKETDVATIMKYGAMSTPGVVIDEELVHAGGVPTVEEVRSWLRVH
ncbi:MAG TPA: thioredoxin family protein [Planctomycetes bacterium]|nr:thioredoxin family protein [Planctomycetota bacterium]